MAFVTVFKEPFINVLFCGGLRLFAKDVTDSAFGMCYLCKIFM